MSDLAHIQKRINWHFLEADAEADLAASREARALYALFLKYIKTARLKPTFFDSARATDMVTGIQYYNAYEEPIKYPKLSDMHILACEVNRFAKIPRAADLMLVLAIHNDLSHPVNGEYYGFRTDKRKTLVLYEYIEPENPDDADKFTVEDLKFLLGAMATDAKSESTFTHEYRHYLDDIGAREKRPQGNLTPTVDPKKDYKGYINSTKEVNARYAEWILSIVASFSRLIAIKQDGVAKRFPRYDEFWHFYWDTAGFVPPELKKHARPSTQKRLTRRLYKFYEWIKTQEKNKAVIDDTKAINFVKKQIWSELSPDEKESLKYNSRFDILPRG